MGMGFAPTWLRQVSPMFHASQNQFNHWHDTEIGEHLYKNLSSYFSLLALFMSLSTYTRSFQYITSLKVTFYIAANTSWHFRLHMGEWGLRFTVSNPQNAHL